jgi:hypothetical protein
MQRTREGRRAPHARWHQVGGRERLSLDVVCADLAQRETTTGADYVRWILDAYVVGQSLRATVAKGPQSRTGDFVYFIVPDTGGYRLNQPPSLASYLQVDSPRLRIALRMLQELELISVDPALRITPEGRRLLGRLRLIHAQGLREGQ